MLIQKQGRYLLLGDRGLLNRGRRESPVAEQVVDAGDGGDHATNSEIRGSSRRGRHQKYEANCEIYRLPYKLSEAARIVFRFRSPSNLRNRGNRSSLYRLKASAIASVNSAERRKGLIKKT